MAGERRGWEEVVESGLLLVRVAGAAVDGTAGAVGAANLETFFCPVVAVLGYSADGDPVRGVTGHDDPVRGVTGRGDPAKGVTGHGDPVRGVTALGDPVKGVTGRDDPVMGVTGHGDPVKGVTGQGDPVRDVTGWGSPVRGDPVQGVAGIELVGPAVLFSFELAGRGNPGELAS